VSRYGSSSRNSSGQAGSQPRGSRPNPRHPQGADVEELVAVVRGAISTTLDVLPAHDSPVSEAVFEVVGTADPVLALRVLEGVLADPPTRMMLALHGLHTGGKGRRQ
jgi:hypothetical protein